jgi:phosphoglycerate dehydrogenase-like enzyme
MKEFCHGIQTSSIRKKLKNSKTLKELSEFERKKLKKKDWHGKRTLVFNSNQGFDNVDIKTCGEKGIIVSNVPEFEI